MENKRKLLFCWNDSQIRIDLDEQVRIKIREINVSTQRFDVAMTFSSDKENL